MCVNSTVPINFDSLIQTREGDPKGAAKISAIKLLTTGQLLLPYSVITHKLFF